MRRLIPVAVVMFVFLGLCVGRGQQLIHKPAAQFPGSVLKWIHIAEKEFTKEHLDASRYVVELWDEQDSVTVLLQNPGRHENVTPKGDPGPLPEYEVEIDRHTGRVIRSPGARFLKFRI